MEQGVVSATTAAGGYIWDKELYSKRPESCTGISVFLPTLEQPRARSHDNDTGHFGGLIFNAFRAMYSC
jgi:hypothetical protein